MTRDVEKKAALLRAQRALERKIEDIDWKHDVLLPELAKFKAEIAAGVTYELDVVTDDSED